MATAVRLPSRAEFAIVRGLCALPRPLRRLLAGPPVKLDGQVLASDIDLVIRLAALTGETSVTGDGQVEEARAQYRLGSAATTGPPIPMARVEGLEIPGPAGRIGARLYDHGTGTAAPRGMLVYYHGGGWVIGDLDTHDGLCRFLAAATEALVLSVDYRLAPEHPFPAPGADAHAAFAWAVENATELGADPARIAVGGDSAGGNLATVVSRTARDAGEPLPAMQLMLYPVTDDVEDWPSRRTFASGFLLTSADMDWFRDRYVTDPALVAHPDASPFQAEDLSGLPPAYVATAGFDPLRDEGEAYAKKLRGAGVEVALRRHPSLIHGFGQLTAVSRVARAAMFEVAGAVRMGLGGGAT